MGRSAYTPQTVSFLVHGSEHAASSSRSGGSSRSSTSSTPTNEDTPKPPTIEDLLFVRGSGSTGAGTSHSRAYPSTGRAAHAIEPVTWSQCKFDPDDERLPVVTERPLGPDDFLNSRQSGYRDAYFQDSGEEEEHEPRGVNVEESDDASEASSQDDYSTGDIPMFTAPSRAPVIFIGDEDDAEGGEGQENVTIRIHPSRSALFNLGPEDDQDLRLHTGSDMHDHHSQSSLDDFSPSVGVFHTHTLPFNLPDNPNELHVQRRVSSNPSPLTTHIADMM